MKEENEKERKINETGARSIMNEPRCLRRPASWVSPSVLHRTLSKIHGEEERERKRRVQQS